MQEHGKHMPNRVAHGHEKSWKLKMYFAGLDKSQNFIHFRSKYFVLFENWKHCLRHQAKILGFQHFLFFGKIQNALENVIETSLSFISQFLCEICQTCKI